MSPAVQEAPTRLPAPARVGRRKKSFVVFLAATCLLVWFAPLLVARTALLDHALGWLFTGIDGTISARSASLGWLSPVVLEDVSLSDSDGRPAVQVGRVEGQKTLLDLVLHPREPGRFRCLDTRIDVSISDGMTNLEAILLPWLTGGDSTSLDGTAVQVEIADAMATLVDELSGERWEVPQMTVMLKTPRHWSNPMQLELHGRIRDERASESRADLILALHYEQAAGNAVVTVGEADATFSQLPMAMAGAVARRADPSIRLGGDLSGEVHATWGPRNDGIGEVQLEGRLSARDPSAGTDSSMPQLDGTIELEGRARGNRNEVVSDLTATANFFTPTDGLANGEPLRGSGPNREAPSTNKPAEHHFNADLHGRVTDLQGACQLELKGTFRSDLYAMLATLFPEATDQVAVTGAETATFEFRGPLAAFADMTSEGTKQASEVPPATGWQFDGLAATAELDWTSISAHGFVLGPAKLRGALADGMLRFDPIRTHLGDGRFEVAPKVEFVSGSVILGVEPGAKVDRLQLTPEVCDQGLQYILPIVAGVVGAEGLISLELADCRVPTGDPSETELTGTLSVHNAKLTGSSLVQSLAAALRLPATARIVEQSTITFRMADRRVEHHGLQVVLGNATVHFNGSVGLDHTLNLTAEFPLDSGPLGDLADDLRLDQQTLRIPITGTLEKPVLDLAALRRDFKKTLRGTAEDALESEINRQLRRLFK